VLALDVNVLVDAYREDSVHHRVVRPWLERTIANGVPIVLFEPVLAGFVRIVTHPTVFDPPTPIAKAFAFVRALRERPGALVLRAGRRQFEIFESLCSDADARGNLVADAYLAALAIEHGCTWVTNDRDFARFERLDWRTPG
jgi:toxin-antitoxin system PIN domain toxin